jgi:hypothetical protein
MTDTQDAAPRVRVEERYPAARAGLAYLAAVLDGTADENVAQFHALDAAGIADMFLSCVELRTVIEDVVRRQLNRETTDRFLSQHSSDVERAVRAHWRESAELREQSARIGGRNGDAADEFRLVASATADGKRSSTTRSAPPNASGSSLPGSAASASSSFAIGRAAR